MKPTCYDILGVKPDATLAAIKAAYRRLLKQLHPDLHGPAARDRLDEVVRAYRVLETPASRQQYDRSLGVVPLPEDGWRSLVNRLRHWLGEVDGAPRDRPPAPPASTQAAQPQTASFEQAMHAASGQPAAGYARGADGVIRRVGPARPMPEFASTHGRPTALQRPTLPKDRPWQLW